MIRKTWTNVVLLVIGAVAFGAQALDGVDQSRIERLVIEYYMSDSLEAGKLNGLARILTDRKSSAAELFHRCEDERDEGGESCTDAACDMLGSLGCNEMSELENVGRACRGNFSGGCLRSTCQKLGSLGCNEMSEIESVARLCRGHVNGRCVDTACDLLGSLGCNELSEMESVARVCKGVRAGCIESTCRRLGSLGCNEISEIEAVARACRGE